MENFVHIVQLLDALLINNPVYIDFLDNEDTIWEKYELCEEGDDYRETLAIYLANYLDIDFIANGATRACYMKDGYAIKINLNNDYGSPSATESMLFDFLWKQGYTFTPRLYYYTNTYSILEYIPNEVNLKDIQEQVDHLISICSALGIRCRDLNHSEQFGMRDNGELVILDMELCSLKQ